MAAIGHSVAALRVFGDALNPEELTLALRHAPTDRYQKGDIHSLPGGRVIVRKTGMWTLEVSGEHPDSLESQITRICAALSPDLDVWVGLVQRFKVDIFCGIFMQVSDEGFDLSPATLQLLADRGIRLSVCIYAPDGGPPSPQDPCPCNSGKIYGECCASS